MALTLFSKMSIHIPLVPFSLFLILVLLMGIWAVFTVVINYHWKNYGVSKIEFIGMNLIYFIGSGLIMLGMALCAFLYNYS